MASKRVKLAGAAVVLAKVAEKQPDVGARHARLRRRVERLSFL